MDGWKVKIEVLKRNVEIRNRDLITLKPLDMGADFQISYLHTDGYWGVLYLIIKGKLVEEQKCRRRWF